jgi:hypothetical protein
MQAEAALTCRGQVPLPWWPGSFYSPQRRWSQVAFSPTSPFLTSEGLTGLSHREQHNTTKGELVQVDQRILGTWPVSFRAFPETLELLVEAIKSHPDCRI